MQGKVAMQPKRTRQDIKRLINETKISEITDMKKLDGIRTEVAVSTSVSTLANNSPVDLDQ